MKKLILLVSIAIATASCGSDSSDTTIPALLPEQPPADTFTSEITNQYWPLKPGNRWVYESVEDGDKERIEVEVLSETKLVAGFAAVVVRDVVSVDGEVIEDTFDWYAQDADGNVWYVGEDSTEFENGEAVSTAGSWEAGVDGALPGIIMYRDPMSVVDQPYFQEYYEGEAVDKARVLRMEPSVTVAAGTYQNVIVIEEWNPLEPGVVEHKYVAAGVGVILEEIVEGGNERAELISFTGG